MSSRLYQSFLIEFRLSRSLSQDCPDMSGSGDWMPDPEDLVHIFLSQKHEPISIENRGSIQSTQWFQNVEILTSVLTGSAFWEFYARLELHAKRSSRNA